MNISVIGIGLIGGSIGLAARAAGHRVLGFDNDDDVLSAAVSSGAIDGSLGSLGEAGRDVDLVIVSTPVGVVQEILEGLAVHTDNAIITDVSSTKATIVGIATGLLGARFVGGHPMAGSERHGIEAADPRLFDDAWWILTPTDATSAAAYQLVSEFVTGLGAKAVALDPQAHDELLARLSHLPQLIASAVVSVATGAGSAQAHLGLAAGGFRDVTRIAASQPDMWIDILKANRQAVLDALGDLESELADVTNALEAGEWELLRERLAGARRARLELFAKPDVPADTTLLSLLIPDRPGVLAEVTTAAGELGANIEDIQIFHSTEGGRGRLDLVIAGAEAARRLLDRLTLLGYHVDLGYPE